ncbi:hypothetical protein [Paraburkholderia sp. BCC1884]|uniref:hypothetical protein n=1 Tax=Paraburkholderia sp. BCC1884 TaxID=2562668 RepID=UPI0011820444|nr:hypothetical protein [Paraburkholderia sp. BCC1884]
MLRIMALAECSHASEFASLMGALTVIVIGSLAFWLSQPAGLFAQRPPAVLPDYLSLSSHGMPLHLAHVACYHVDCPNGCTAPQRN